MNTKELSALFSLISAIIVALIALFTPPPGEIHESILWFVAQLIMYTASIFGVSAVMEHHNKSSSPPQTPPQGRAFVDT